ncbi:MAG: hypothetical protein ACYSW0_18425 [Planctomycetota bacterium]|jgi:hypothetical protein
MNITIYRKASGEELVKPVNFAAEDGELIALQVMLEDGKLHELMFYVEEGRIASSNFHHPPTSDRIVRRMGKRRKRDRVDL